MQFRTDMALERRDIYKQANKLDNEIPGIETEEIEKSNNIRITKVKILDEQGEKAIGKSKGTYVTIDIKNLKSATEDEIEEAAVSMKNELQNMINENVEKSGDILVAGLGNREVTPDSLRT